MSWAEEPWQKKFRVNPTLKILYILQRRKTENTCIFFKNEWKEGKPTELLVKCRKLYYVWFLSDACLERGEWELVPGPHFFLSQHQIELKGRSRSGKRNRALKGEFCHSTLRALSISPHGSLPWGPRSMDSEEANGSTCHSETEASGRLLGWRAEHRYLWNSVWRMKPRGAWKRVWPSRSLWAALNQ